MAILSLSSDGLDIAVLDLPVEWSPRCSLAYRFRSSVEAGQSGHENRRPGAEELRINLAVHLVLSGTDAQAFRQQLAILARDVLAGTNSAWIGVPLWLDEFAGADWGNRIHNAGRLFDRTAGAIVDSASSLDPAHVYLPLIVGHIDELPELPADVPDQIDFSFTLFDDSPWEFRAGINASGTPGVWPDLVPDWAQPVVDQPEHGLRGVALGHTRERPLDGQEQAFRWKQQAGFTLDGRTQIRALLAFFVASEGLRRKFDTPWWIVPGTATPEAPSSTKARFASETLTLDYLEPDLAETTVQVVQLPWEVAGVVGETPELGPRVYLYQFSLGLPTPQVSRFTNWVKPLARTGDGTYAPAPMQHREIPDVLDIENNRVMLDSFTFAGNPLDLFHVQGELEAPLTLTIYATETWPVDPDAATAIWVGEVKLPGRNGRAIEAPVPFAASLLELEVPRVRLGPTCNTTFCSAQCKLTLADYLETGTFGATSDGLVLDITTTAANAANYFALGKIELGSGAAWETRSIIASEPITGGQRLTVDWPVRQAAAGQAVVFHPGCARTADACRAWSNYPNFLGHEHVPSGNLTLPQMKMSENPGKK
jgi:uncharacterized phage protein (TIGR02218 family)